MIQPQREISTKTSSKPVAGRAGRAGSTGLADSTGRADRAASPASRQAGVSGSSRQRSPGSPSTLHAFGSRKAVVAFLLVACAALAADLLAKGYVFGEMLNDPVLLARVARPGPNDVLAARGELGKFQRRVMPGVVKFTLSTNPGAVFGMAMPRWLMAVATVLTAAVVLYFFATCEAKAWPIHLALALILGGAMGNLYDRLFSVVALPGYEPIRHQVRDFIDCSDIYYKWIFNLADVWLVVGVAILVANWLVISLRERRRPEPATGRANHSGRG